MKKEKYSITFSKWLLWLGLSAAIIACVIVVYSRAVVVAVQYLHLAPALQKAALTLLQSMASSSFSAIFILVMFSLLVIAWTLDVCSLIKRTLFYETESTYTSGVVANMKGEKNT